MSSSSWVVRVVGGLILGISAFSVKYCMGTDRRADASKQILKGAQEMIKEVPGYDDNRGYMDWLVKEAHQNVFNDSYNIDVGSRYSAGKDSMDFGQYEHDLFAWMIDRANADGSKHIAENLKKFEETPAPDPDAKPAKKKKEENPFVKR